MTELELKKIFAEKCLFNPNNTFLAALDLCNGNHQQAFELSTAWSYDPQVNEFKQQLLAENGEEHYLPTKSQLVHRVMSRIDNGFATNDEFVKLVRLVADIQGLIEKPGVTVNNNITTNKVMNIPVFIGDGGKPATLEQWETQVMKQQATLIEAD